MSLLLKILSPRLVRVHVDAPDKAALLDELSAVLAASHPKVAGHPLDKEAILNAVMARETERSSALGQGCALPHARLDGLEQPVACLATLKHGMNFDAADTEPVRTVCVLLAPLEEPATTLTIMAEIAGLMNNEQNRDTILGAETSESLWDWLCGLEPASERVITARNVMRRPYFTVHQDTPLSVVTQLLQNHHLEATSVVDGDGRLVGMVTCDQIFRHGLPEFFGQLKSVAFVKNFDPFEHYFKGAKTAVASDIMTTDYSALLEDATLLEVIFELSVHRRPKVFVVREGILVGIIDRVSVLDRVLNY